MKISVNNDIFFPKSKNSKNKNKDTHLTRSQQNPISSPLIKHSFVFYLLNNVPNYFNNWTYQIQSSMAKRKMVAQLIQSIFQYILEILFIYLSIYETFNKWINDKMQN